MVFSSKKKKNEVCGIHLRQLTPFFQHCTPTAKAEVSGTMVWESRESANLDTRFMTAEEKKVTERKEVRPHDRTTLSSFNDSLIPQLVEGDMNLFKPRGKGWRGS